MPTPRVQSAKNNKVIRKKFPELKRYLPCFFDVPLRIALEILGLSHHTLDPIRRSLDLERWPFAELARGKFSMKGVRWQRDDVVALRTEMTAGADMEMLRVIKLATARSEEFWSPVPKKEKKKKTVELIVEPVPDLPEINPEVQSLWGDTATDNVSDAGFWEEIARMFSLHIASMQEETEPAAVPAL